jgi:hypothetical protein
VGIDVCIDVALSPVAVMPANAATVATPLLRLVQSKGLVGMVVPVVQLSPALLTPGGTVAVNQSALSATTPTLLVFQLNTMLMSGDAAAASSTIGCCTTAARGRRLGVAVLYGGEVGAEPYVFGAEGRARAAHGVHRAGPVVEQGEYYGGGRHGAVQVQLRCDERQREEQPLDAEG